MESNLQNLTPESFAPFGVIIAHDFPKKTGRDFAVIARDESTGWCVGILELRRDVAPYLERHLDSMETHEPLSGVSILVVAPPENPDDRSVFLLDKPVCLNKAVWHQVMALSESAVIKVIENSSVPPESSENHPLPDGVHTYISM